ADVAALALGVCLNAYAFDKYKTKKDNGKAAAGPARVTILCANPAAAKRVFATAQAVADGVVLARDLVNEPANVLGTLEFAAKARELEALGVKVEILTEKEMRKLRDRKSTRLNSSHVKISYAVFCLKKKKEMK